MFGKDVGVKAMHQKRKASSRRGQPIPPRLLNLSRAAEYLGLSPWTLRQLVANGVVPRVRLPIGRASRDRTVQRLLIDRRDLDAIIEANKERE